MSHTGEIDVDEKEKGSAGAQKGIKRKKKRSFLQNARKYGRQGAFGRGSHLDADTYQYMVRVLELMRDGFPSFDEKLVFVNNVYEESLGMEVEYARNQIGSRVLDSLMKFASFEVMQRLSAAFVENLRPLCSDRFASHVLERIITVSAERATRKLNATKCSDGKGEATAECVVVKDPEVEAYNESVLKLSRYVMNNMEDFVWDTYANHVVRTVLGILGGFIDEGQDSSDNRSERRLVPDEAKRRTVPQEYSEVLTEFCKRLSSWPQFTEFGRNELTSGLLQTVLYSLKVVNDKLHRSIVKKVIDDCFTSSDEAKISNVFDSESSVRLLEVCLAVARPKLYRRIYSKFFVSRLVRLSLMERANFAVQRLFDHCPTKEEFEPMFDEISTSFEAILEKGHAGVLVRLAEACKRLQTRQGAFFSAINKTLHCDQPVDRQNKVALLVLTLTTYEQMEEKSAESKQDYRISLHGSLIVQSMLHFNKPIKVVNSLLAMESRDLKFVFGDPRGSRVMDAFAESKFIGEKSREKMARILQGCWVQLACSRHGSRSLEKVWQWSRVGQRVWIIEELAAAGASLCSTETGKIISSKLNVPLYSRSKKDWLDSLGKEEKTLSLFADVIGDVAIKK